MFIHGRFILFFLIITCLCSEAAKSVNRWRINKDTSSPAAFCMASVTQIDDDSAVFIGGAAANDWGTGIFSSSLHRYNATLRSYEKYNVSLPTGRLGPTVVSMGGKVYIIGGSDYTSDLATGFFNDMYEFDPIASTLSDNITVVGSGGPIPMLYGAAAQVDDDQFVYFSGQGPPGRLTSEDFWTFNVKSKEWTIRGKMPLGPTQGGSAVTLYHHFGDNKHGVLFLGGSLGIDPYAWPKKFDLHAWILNPESWELKNVTTGISDVLPTGEHMKLTAEQIPATEGTPRFTRVWSYGSELHHICRFERRSNTLQYLDIPEGYDGPDPLSWQLLPIVNPNTVVGSSLAAYMLHRRPGRQAEPHILGGCMETNFGNFFQNETYSVSRDDPGANGTQSLLYDVTNHPKDGEIILIRAGEEAEFRMVACDADREQLNYGIDQVTTFLTHNATKQRLFPNKLDNSHNGSWNFTYTPQMAGAWLLEVFLNGELVNNRTKFGSPIILNVIPTTPVPDHTMILGDGIDNPTAGTWSPFTVRLRDTYNNTVLKDDAQLANVSVTIIPKFNLPSGSASRPLDFISEITDDGIEVTYRTNLTGSYKISTFMGHEAIRSDIDVDVVRDPIVNVDPPSAMSYSFESPEAFATIVLLFLTVVGIILCAACMIGIVKYRDENIIKAIDVTGSLICLSGLMLLFVSGLFWISGEPTIMTCNMWPFFVSLGLGVVFSTLAGKIWQVYKIFTTKVRRKVSKWNSIVVQGLIVLIDIIICATWIVVDPPAPMVKYPDTYFSHRDCSSSSPRRQKVFVAFIVSYNGLFVFGGLALAYLTRDLPSRFNQAAHIAVSMQSFIILALFGLPVLEFIDKYLVAKTYARFLIIWVPAMITTVFLFGSRVYVASRTRKLQRERNPSISGDAPIDSKAASFVQYIASTTSDAEREVTTMNHFTVFWCHKHWLLPNIWLQSTMFVVPSIGILAFTDHEYGDAHTIVDTRNATIERLPWNMHFQYMIRLCTQNSGVYLIGAFTSPDLAKIDYMIKSLIEKNVDCFQVSEKSESAPKSDPVPCLAQTML